MDESNFALLVGVNEYEDGQLSTLKYAEKDCRDLRDVLTDPEIGCFPPDNVRLLLGEDATTEAVETALYRHAVTECKGGETVVVHFSGHGFVHDTGDRRRSYLGTHDVSIQSLLENPRRGLRMDFLHDEILMESRAARILLILDCCHSGAIVPVPFRSRSGSEGDPVAPPAAPLKRTAELSARDLIERGFLTQGSGRIALVACPHDAVSRESDSLKNGVFTHSLLRGLKGSAVETGTGEITVDSLMAYVRTSTPADQPPGRYGQDFGRVVLTRPGRPSEDVNLRVHLEPAAVTAASAAPLPHPLDPCLPFLGSLREALDRDPEQKGADIGGHILDAVRDASGARYVSVLRQDEDEWVLKADSSSTSESVDRRKLFEGAVKLAAPALAGGDLFSSSHHGMLCVGDGDESVVAVPLKSGLRRELMVVEGLDSDSVLMSDVLARMLRSVYDASREMTTVRPAEIEAFVLDDLREISGFVPYAVYRRRLELFRERLGKMVIHFEPVVRLSPNELHISGWEALARDPETLVAPGDLFESARLWGVRFMTELDQYFIRTAVHRYRELRREIPGQRRQEDVQELSVNAFPQSLMVPTFFDTVRELVLEEAILPEKLVLEISESTELPEPENGDAAIDAFRDRLESFVHDLGINFAIDDFGSGYSSISRLTGLSPAFVKIDRSVLHSEFARETIRYVLDLVSRGRLRAPKVVVEGVDSESRLKIEDLYELGVKYIQGYLVRKPGPETLRLDKDLAESLQKRLRAVAQEG